MSGTAEERRGAWPRRGSEGAARGTRRTRQVVLLFCVQLMAPDHAAERRVVDTVGQDGARHEADLRRASPEGTLIETRDEPGGRLDAAVIALVIDGVILG